MAWLNADDVYYPGAIERAVAALRADPDAALVYGEGDLIGEDGALLRRFPETVPFDLWRLANVADYILQPTVFFRRSALVEEGFALDEDLHWGLDWDLWLRIAARLPLCYTPHVLAASRVYLDTKTASGGFRRLRELLGILRRHGAPRLSPAAAAHTVSTCVRALRPSVAPMTARDVSRVAPPGARWLVRPIVGHGERWLRRWLQNAQGVWSDSLVGRTGHLWLPSRGGARVLQVTGRNLDLDHQVVRLEVDGRRLNTPPLAPRQEFALELQVRGDGAPIKATLKCARTTRVAPLDRTLGPRRAGWSLLRAQPGAA